MRAEQDRSAHDTDKYSQAERDQYAEKLEAIDNAKDIFLLEVGAAARKYGLTLEAADPRFVLWNGKERGHEAVQGFVEHTQAVCADLAGDVRDAEEVAKAESIVEVGYAY